MGRSGAWMGPTFLAGLLLASCAPGGAGDSTGAMETPSATVEASLEQPNGSSTDAASQAGCFLTNAEVTAATGTTLLRPTEGSMGPKGDASCLYYLAPEQTGGFGCHCLSTNGPFDLEGQGTDWLKDLPAGGQMVSGVGDRAAYLAEGGGDELWAVKGQIGIHISIDYQHLSADQMSDLARAAFARL